MYHVTSIMFVSSFVCPFDFPGKLAQKSYWWSPPALVDEASQRHRLPDRFAFAVADATLLGFVAFLFLSPECGLWLCALFVFCSFLCLVRLRWIAFGLCLFGALLVQRSCVLR